MGETVSTVYNKVTLLWKAGNLFKYAKWGIEEISISRESRCNIDDLAVVGLSRNRWDLKEVLK